MQTTHLKALPFALVKEFFSSIVRFPFWWYTKGLLLVFKKTTHSLHTASEFFGFGVWARNLFTPMYGDESMSGRFISFLVRFAAVLAKGAAVLLWAAFAWILFVAYLVVLPIAIFGLIYQLI